MGRSAAEVDALDDDGLSALVEQLRGWALCLTTGGLAALMAEVRAEGLLGRVLGRPGGERDLTDLDHLLELMQASVGGRATAASALLSVLDGLLDPDLADEDAIAPEVLSRRIDRDDDTVKVLTVHRAKGLEFPVVLCPTLWRKRPNLQGVPHADVAGYRRVRRARASVGRGSRCVGHWRVRTVGIQIGPRIQRRARSVGSVSREARVGDTGVGRDRRVHSLEDRRPPSRLLYDGAWRPPPIRSKSPMSPFRPIPCRRGGPSRPPPISKG